MISKDLLMAFNEYAREKSEFSFAEMQYDMKLDYAKAKELLSLVIKTKWAKLENNRIYAKALLRKQERFTETKCKRIAKLLDAPKMALLSEVVERGSIEKEDARRVMRKNGQMRFMTQVITDFLANLELIYIIDDTIYPSIDKETLEKIKACIEEE